jgi:small subunit ribosomal protein S1
MSGESTDSAPAQQGTSVIKRATGKPPEESALETTSPGAGGANLDDLLGGDSGLLSESEHSGDALAAEDLGSAADAIAAELNEDFAALLADAGGLTEFKVGDAIAGTIVSITHDAVFIDVGGKSEAYLERRDILDAKGELTHQVGDEITAQVVVLEGEGIRLSRGALKAREVSEMLEEAAANKLPVEGTVVGHNAGGLEIRLGGRRAFCPRSQVDRDFSEDLESHVGQTYRFIVTRFDPTGRKLVVSRRMVQESEARVLAKETRGLIEVGAIVDGTVRKVMEFGVFVDLGGIDGLVHVSELSWSRVEHPKEIVTDGQAVRVKILKIDSGKDRISLSMKQAQGDPWKDVVEGIKVGQKITVHVEKVEKFGVFCVVADGVTGLLPNSHTESPRGGQARRNFRPGQKIEVTVIDMDRKRRKITLSQKGDGADGNAGEYKAYQKQVRDEQKAGPSALALALMAARDKK